MVPVWGNLIRYILKLICMLIRVIGKDFIAYFRDVKLPQFHGKERKVSYRGSNSALVLLCWVEFSLKVHR